MEYVRLNLKDGDVLDENHIKHIEDGIVAASKSNGSFDPKGYDLPVLYLTGDISPIAESKDNDVELNYTYGERTGTCKLKGQGASSYKMAKAFIDAGRAGKFNYTIKFDNEFEVKKGTIFEPNPKVEERRWFHSQPWGEQKKYCLKANWIDHTHARNVVSAKIWGGIVKNRTGVSDALKALPCGGAVDGFPVIIMLNNEFHGLYTFNIPKDGWMFGLVENSTKTQAMLGANDHELATQFKGELAGDESDFELEFVSDKNNKGWVTTSLNRLINACKNSDGSDLDTTVAKYLDWDSAIDYYIYTVVIRGEDMVDKNFLITTFDGTKWFFTAYDMDSTFGLSWDASQLNRPVSDISFEACATTSRVFELIKKFKTNALKARYAQLRQDVLSESRIIQIFENFAWDIPSPALTEDVKKYPTIRGSSVNGIDQIGRWIRQRLVTTDAWINELSAQEETDELKNWAHFGEDTAEKSIYNGVGYKDNARLSSSGGVSGTAQNGSVVTGFIPYKFGKYIQMKGATWLGNTAAYSGTHWYIGFYGEDKKLVDENTNNIVSEGSYLSDFASDLSVVYDASTGVTTFSWVDPNKSTGLTQRVRTAKYFRINAYGKGADLKITVNRNVMELD